MRAEAEDRGGQEVVRMGSRLREAAGSRQPERKRGREQAETEDVVSLTTSPSSPGEDGEQQRQNGGGIKSQQQPRELGDEVGSGGEEVVRMESSGRAAAGSRQQGRKPRPSGLASAFGKTKLVVNAFSAVYASRRKYCDSLRHRSGLQDHMAPA